MSKSKYQQRGAAGVEFALIQLFFWLMAFAVVETGIAFYKQQGITATAREAARFGAMANDPRPTADNVEVYANDYLAGVGIDPGDAVVNVSGAGGESGSLLSVEVLYPASFSIVGAIAALVGQQGPAGTIILQANIAVELE